MRSERPRGLPNRYRWLIRTLTGIENAVLVVLLSTMIVLAAGQVVMRNLLDFGFPWSDPMTRLLVLWVGLIGAMVASRNNKHINMDVVSRWLPESMLQVTRIATGLFTAVVCGVVAYNAARFVYLDYRDGLVAFGLLPAWIAEAVVPFAFGVMGLRYLLYCFLPPGATAGD